MGVREVLAMGYRASPPHMCPFSASRPSDRKGMYCVRFCHVAGKAALLGMAGGAGGRGLAGEPTVAEHELRVSVAWGGLQLGFESGGARIRPQGLDDRYLGSIYMTLGAEVAGMARSAGC